MDSYQDARSAIGGALDNARELLTAARALLDTGQPARLAYHFAALALEEVGKASILGMRVVRSARERDLPSLPVESLASRIAATEVALHNGRKIWAVLGNVDLNAPMLTRQFLTLSFYIDDAWFHLARYHDLDVEERGPVALANRLGMSLSDVFPIQYDLSQVAIGDEDVVRGAVPAEPSERLSRAELISLAVRGSS
jgi:hypothetical protein